MGVGTIKAVLIDIAGTLVYGNKPIPGSLKIIPYLRNLGLKILFTTNTDSRTPKTIHRELVDMGFDILERRNFHAYNCIKGIFRTPQR